MPRTAESVLAAIGSGWSGSRLVPASSTHANPGDSQDYSSDTELVTACVGGRPGAFAILMERYQRRVYAVCYRFVGNHEDASDLSQEVFLRVHRGLQRFKGNAALATWVYRIAVNVSLSHVNRKPPRTEPIETDRLLDQQAVSPVELVARGQRSERVRSAIAALPDRQRATLILRVYHDLSHHEIAEMLGSSVGAVKANVFHALAKLRKQLSSESV